MLKGKIEGIYIITNMVNNKVYIGQSKNIKTRFYEHRYNLKNNKHTNSHLQNACNIDGIESFKFEVLEECPKELRNEREIYWINHYNSTNAEFGYNYQSGGCENQTIAQETKDKISKALKGIPRSEEVKMKIGKANTGRKYSKEISEKLSALRKGRQAWNKGKPQSEEQKRKHSERMTGRKRQPHSEETKRKIRESNKKTWDMNHS